MKSMKFVQVSDIHLGAPKALINGCSPTERLYACFKDITSWHSDAEFCVITGDLTEYAEPAAYRHLKEILLAVSYTHLTLPTSIQV